MPDFWGFFPRIYLPHTKVFKDSRESDEMAKLTLFFIDSTQEIKTGVGLNFPVCSLDENEMQLDSLIA